ncbi:MAG TPA: paraquat-inducible protein A [Nevskiaceae bacterium]|nr:paraquat-inducible protein A [Nevskiaceae bacterium]
MRTLSTPLIVCEHCDAVYRRRELPDGATARCLRCDASIDHRGRRDLSTLVALALASLVTFCIANAYPIVAIEMEGSGDHSQTTLWGAVVATWRSGVGPLAVLAWACAFFLPLAEILANLYVAVPLSLGRVPRGFNAAMHTLRLLRPWSMMEVFMLGSFVAVVKLGSYAAVVVGIGLYAFAALTLLLTLLGSYELRDLWAQAQHARAAA